jgi:hypothetical protein
MEQLVLLVIIGLISLVNWLMQKAAEKREAAGQKRAERREVKRETRRNVYTQGPSAPAPARRTGAPGQDPFKELMDALGLPSDEAPPPPVVPREEIREEEFASLEESAPPPLPQPEVRAPRWQSPSVRRPDAKTAQLASAFASVDEKPAVAYRGSSLHDFLAGRDAQRKAVVLAEILGTPRGLAKPDALMAPGHL